jgi:hypothetical protein
MINMQEQLQIGFKHLSGEIRSLNTSAQPQVFKPKEKSIENIQHDEYSQPKERSIQNIVRHDEYDEDKADNEQEIEEIVPECEDSYSEEEQSIDSEAQKQFVKERRKQIRVCFI